MAGDFGISAGIGGIVTRVHGRKARKFAQSEAEKQRVWNERMADTEIQRRVRDAQLAGIHPLFALGGSAGASAPINLDFGADSGGREIAEAGGQFVRDLRGTEEEERQARIAVLRSEAERNDAVAESTRMSAAARAVQTANASQDSTVNSVGHSYGFEAPMVHQKGKMKAQQIQDLYGDLAENVEGSIMYIRDKGKQIAEDYRDELSSVFDSFVKPRPASEPGFFDRWIYSK